MLEVKESDLSKITGGGFSLGVAIGVGALVVFVIGLIDGYTNPIKCGINQELNTSE